MNIIEDFVLLETGSRVFYRCILPESGFDVVIIGSHGLTAHSGVYLPIAEAFARRGTAFCMHDQRGHGRTASENERGYVNTFLDFVLDVQKFSDYIKWKIRGNKIVLLGHSMGGLVVLLASILAKNDIDAVVALAPALELQLKTSHRVVLKILSKVSPRHKLKLHHRNVQKHDEELKKIRDYNLILSEVSVKLIDEMVRAANLFWSSVDSMSKPVLLIHGEKDNLIPFTASKRAFEKIRSSHKKLLIYAEFGHNLFLEPGGERIVEDIVKWIRDLPS